MAANIHALLLLLIPVAAIFFCLKYRGLPKGWRNWVGAFVRTAIALMGSVVVLYVLSLSCRCGPGNNPSSQKLLPMLAVLAIAFFVDSPKVRRLAISLFLVLGFVLSWHFHHLVLDGKTCAYTGDAEYILNSCEVPARAVPLWHSSLTGIYGIEKNAQ